MVTLDLVKTEFFMGIPVRIIRIDDKYMIPLVDIAHGISYEPGNLKKLYDRNTVLLKEYSQTCMMTSGNQAAPVPHICLNRDGITGILMKLDYRRIVSEEKKQHIIDFQHFMIETLGKINEGKINEIRPFGHKQKEEYTDDAKNQNNHNWKQITEEHIAFGKWFAKEVGADTGIAYAHALRAASKMTGVDVTGYIRLLPPASSDTPHLTATDIARIIGCGRTAKEINHYLMVHGYHIQDSHGEWQLTELGKTYGANFPYVASNGHAGYYIRWKESVIVDSKMVQNNPHRIAD